MCLSSGTSAAPTAFIGHNESAYYARKRFYNRENAKKKSVWMKTKPIREISEQNITRAYTQHFLLAFCFLLGVRASLFDLKLPPMHPVQHPETEKYGRDD